MKITKLSLIATLAMSASFAGGDIAPVEPIVEAPVVETASSTTVDGKLTGYYITYDGTDSLFGDQSQLAWAATLNVSHAFNSWATANFSAVGYINTWKLEDTDLGYFEAEKEGGFFNVANLTTTFGDTTFILGRQLLNTPMLAGFDWLLAPGSFEAYTVANSSVENLTLIGSYVRKYRPVNSGEFGNVLDGDNYTLAAAYDNKTLNGQVWYYDIGAANYTQVYADLGTTFSGVELAAQYVSTMYDTTGVDDASVFGVKAAATLGGFGLMAAYNNSADNVASAIGIDSLYTTSWNTFTSGVQGDSWKVEASTELAGISAALSYAYYEYAQAWKVEEGAEIDFILGYNVNEAIDLNVVYTNTDYGDGAGDINGLEIFANYKF
ncbi:MAG: hypothetical protein U9O64_05010 [Campylobacterota bacterium]|nr:hypothetical protein [Campylobacterota bacterium]